MTRRTSQTYGPRRATAVAVGFALLLCGAVAGRLTAPDPAPGGPAPAPQAAGPGPTATAGGLPVGYTRTEDGAVAAAATLLAALGGRTLVDPVPRKAALDAVALPSAREQVETQLRVDPAGAQAAGLPAALADGSLVARTIPAGSRLVSYTPDTATVEVWAVALLGTRTLNRATARWNTTTVELRWDGDWKIAAIRGRSGPVPSPGRDTPSRFDDFLTAVTGLEGHTYAPLE